MKTLLAFLSLIVGVTSPVFGIVLHYDAIPDTRPSDDFIARWGTYASAVVVAPNYVVTTNHQGGGVGTSITVAGSTYMVAEVITSVTDMRIARITNPDGTPANLSTYVQIGTDPSAYIRWQEVYIGGFGKGRGDDLTTDGTVYGYQWTSSKNLTYTWGTNTIDKADGIWLYADFDALTAVGATTYESAAASGDSGGGWIIRDPGTGEWVLVGLTQGVERSAESWFLNESNPSLPDADRIYAIDIRPYGDWIYANVAPEPSSMVLLGIGSFVFFVQRRRRK